MVSTENISFEWENYIDALRPIGGRLLGTPWEGASPLARQETCRMLFAGLAQGFINYVQSDPDYPDWKPGYDTALNLMAPVPDYRYKVTLIDGEGSYRITGFRGTSRFVDITIFSSLFSLGKAGPVVGRISLDTLKLGPNGEYELILSAERPQGYQGDWHVLAPQAMRLQVRHASYDWFNEVDARMAIERLDRPAAQPRASAEAIKAKLSALAKWTENTVSFGIKHINAQCAKGLVNRMAPMDWGEFGGFNANIQAYVEGLFEIADDEALILETELPDTARYWSVLLADNQFATIDWMNRQSSLNGHQAKVDSDGRFRAVIALHDPGVPNWLDTGGYHQGVIQVRWNECSSAPVPTLQKVKLRDIRQHLPDDTASVPPEERDVQLRHRRRGAQMRSRW